jgi:O-antigen/teichoic acid export membrane protein
VGLNLWLVPRAGLIGAAGANVASEAAILASVLWATGMGGAARERHS